MNNNFKDLIKNNNEIFRQLLEVKNLYITSFNEDDIVIRYNEVKIHISDRAFNIVDAYRVKIYSSNICPLSIYGYININNVIAFISSIVNINDLQSLDDIINKYIVTFKNVYFISLNKKYTLEQHGEIHNVLDKIHNIIIDNKLPIPINELFKYSIFINKYNDRYEISIMQCYAYNKFNSNNCYAEIDSDDISLEEKLNKTLHKIILYDDKLCYHKKDFYYINIYDRTIDFKLRSFKETFNI